MDGDAAEHDGADVTALLFKIGITVAAIGWAGSIISALAFNVHPGYGLIVVFSGLGLVMISMLTTMWREL